MPNFYYWTILHFVLLLQSLSNHLLQPFVYYPSYGYTLVYTHALGTCYDTGFPREGQIHAWSDRVWRIHCYDITYLKSRSFCSPFWMSCRDICVVAAVQEFVSLASFWSAIASKLSPLISKQNTAVLVKFLRALRRDFNYRGIRWWFIKHSLNYATLDDV
jgi:hypothetical protein